MHFLVFFFSFRLLDIRALQKSYCKQELHQPGCTDELSCKGLCSLHIEYCWFSSDVVHLSVLLSVNPGTSPLLNNRGILTIYFGVTSAGARSRVAIKHGTTLLALGHSVRRQSLREQRRDSKLLYLFLLSRLFISSDKVLFRIFLIILPLLLTIIIFLLLLFYY